MSDKNKVFKVTLGSECPWCHHVGVTLIISDLSYVKCLGCSKAGKKCETMQEAANSFYMAHFYSANSQGVD